MAGLDLRLALEGVRWFSAREVEPLLDPARPLDADLFLVLDDFRDMVECGVKLLSLNGGTHTAGSQHYKGKAVDFVLLKERDPLQVAHRMLDAGFRGIGIYWNGAAYSYHGDLRERHASWTGWKTGLPHSEWVYGKLLRDPRSGP